MVFRLQRTEPQVLLAGPARILSLLVSPCPTSLPRCPAEAPHRPLINERHPCPVSDLSRTFMVEGHPAWSIMWM